MAKQFTLGKNERLKSRKQIEQLFSEGKKFSVTPFRILYLQQPLLTTHHSPFTIQFGIAVSTKNFKRAVDRNRIKRLSREAWRLQKNELTKELKAAGKQLNVFFIYTGKEIPEYNWVYEKTKAAIQKLIKAIEQQEKL